MTRSQVDRLGARLRTGGVTAADLRLLDEYRQSFADGYDIVMRVLRDDLLLNPTGRAAKSTAAIVGKLGRETLRLSQIHDIAGCRVVVPDVPAQDATVRALVGAFDSVLIVDRRERPSHGYRAVHVLVRVHGTVVEVQVRTVVQQLWAEMCERLSDHFGIEVKYGGGPPEILDLLDRTSRLVTTHEIREQQVLVFRDLIANPAVPVEIRAEFDGLISRGNQLNEEIRQMLEELLEQVP